MQPFRARSAVEQLAQHLREEIMLGGLGETMPGVAQLVGELGVGTETVIAAMDILEREGLLAAQGPRRRRKIVRPDGTSAPGGLRVKILQYEASDTHDEHMVALRHRLEEQGHKVANAAKTLVDLNFDVDRVARLVEKTGGDAWVVRAGSQPVLKWFAARPIPTFAMFGRQPGIPMASLATLKSPAMAVALRQLVALGHRRIVMMAREERRHPLPGLFERRYLQELKQLGIQVGAYNLPNWKNDRHGYHQCLESLFHHTPPSALLIGEPALLFATQQFLSRQGLTAPRDVSLISLDDHPAFEWFKPEVSLIRTDSRRWVRRVVEWVGNVARGQEDRRQTLIRSVFVEGGTIGPAVR